VYSSFSGSEWIAALRGLPADVLGMAHVAAASAAAPTPPAAAAAAAASCDQPPSTHHLKQQQQQECLSDAAATAADVSARAALAAFTAAARAGLSSLPELWFNRAAVALHLGELATALTVGGVNELGCIRFGLKFCRD
jgi:hypothetical protein